MKKILLILLLLPTIASAQLANRDQWDNLVFQSYVVPGICEYLSAWWRASDSGFYAGGNDLSLRGNGAIAWPQARVSKVPVTGVAFQDVSNALHDDVGVSGPVDGHRAYIIGANNYGQYGDGTTTASTMYHLISTDSSGNNFNNIKLVAGGWHAVNGGQFYTGIKYDGSLWGWGRMDEGGSGNQSSGTALRKPSQITLALGKSAQFVQCAEQCVILCTDSTLQSFQNDNGSPANLGRTFTGTGNRSPADMGMAHIVGISIGYAVSYAWDANGDVWAWGLYCKFYGGQNHTGDNGTVTTPIKITSVWNLPARVKNIVCNHNSTLILLTNGTLYNCGGVPTGIPGVGFDFDWANYTGTSGTTPYNGGTPDPWNWHVEYAIPGGTMSYYVIATPQQITVGKHNWANIWGSSMWGFDFGAVDSLNTFVMWGRNKGSVIPNGIYPADSVRGHLQANFHVSWDEDEPEIVNPFSVPVFQQVSSPNCLLHPTVDGCDLAPIPTRTAPHASVTSFTTVPGQVVANGTASTAFFFTRKHWKNLTKPAGAATVGMQIQTGFTDTFNLSTVGTYTFQLNIEDDAFQKDSAVSTIIVTSATQTSFYFNMSTGNDANPCTLASPCKLNYNTLLSTAITAGDTLLFNKGDSFNVPLRVLATGTSTQKINFFSYGSASAPPVVTGFSTITGWVNEGNSVYGAFCAACKQTTNLVVKDGQNLTIARWPNNSYRRFYHINSSTFSDSTLPNPANYVNVTVCIKDGRYIIDTLHTVSQTGGTFTLSGAPTLTDLSGHGYFFMNAKQFLDSNNEYYVDPVTDTLYVVSTDAITSHNIKVSSDTTVWIDHKYFININGINFAGGNQHIFLLNSDSNISISNCNMAYGGNNIMTINQVPQLTLLNDTLKRGNNNGITGTGSTSIYATIKFCQIDSIGLLPGMGKSGSTISYAGISWPFGFNLIEYNTIFQTGYHGIYYSGDSVNIFYNWVHHFGMVKSDVGGYYTWDPSFQTYSYPANITGNHATYGFNDTAGTNYTITDVAIGFYFDGHAKSRIMTGNTSAFNSTSGILIHGSNINVTNNNFYGNGYAQAQISKFSGIAITGLFYKGNFHGSSSSSQLGIAVTTPDNDINTFGTLDQNYYALPLANSFYTQSSVDAGTFRNFSSFKSNTGYETLGNSQTVASWLWSNPIATTLTMKPLQYYSDLPGTNTYYRSTTINPYSSIIVTFKGNGNSRSKHGKVFVF